MRTPLAVLPFPQAAEQWLESRRNFLADKTFSRYQEYLKPLKKHFYDLTLPQITAESLRTYQKLRRAEAGATVVNHELSLVQQMLKRIGRWSEIGHDYQALPLPREQKVGRPLSDAEYIRLFRVAASNPKWEATLLFAAISINTSCGPGEVKTLRLKDVDLEQRILTVNPAGAKNPMRARTIPLNQFAYDALKRAMERARELGAVEPDHFIFPFSLHRSGGQGYDPTRHRIDFRGGWRELMAAADIRNFRPYDLRHHALTQLLENPKVSEEMVQSIAGHVGRAMLRRYSHVRMAAKRKAVETLRPPWKKAA